MQSITLQNARLPTTENCLIWLVNIIETQSLKGKERCYSSVDYDLVAFSKPKEKHLYGIIQIKLLPPQKTWTCPTRTPNSAKNSKKKTRKKQRANTKKQ